MLTKLKNCVMDKGGFIMTDCHMMTESHIGQRRVVLHKDATNVALLVVCSHKVHFRIHRVTCACFDNHGHIARI